MPSLLSRMILATTKFFEVIVCVGVQSRWRGEVTERLIEHLLRRACEVLLESFLVFRVEDAILERMGTTLGKKEKTAEEIQENKLRCSTCSRF